MKTIQPYDYQLKHIDDIIRKLGRRRRVLAQLPTGGGKTVEFSLIVDRYLKKNPNKSVLILVHRIELLEQAKNTIDIMFPEYGVDFIVAGVRYVKQCHIYIGMVESVNTRAQFMEMLNLGLVIIDECHIGNFIKMHQIFTEELIIGFTATPLSQSKKTPMKLYYDDISVGPQIKELIELKRLSQNITRCPRDIVDETMLQIDVKTGDFDMRQMGSVFARPKFVMNTFMYYNRFCRNQKTLIFNVNVEHSLEVTDCFNLFGNTCKHIDGDTPIDERRAVLKWFSETDDAILCNVGIVNVGFDEPTIKNVIVNLATLSLPKWLQSCGRGGRYIPHNEFGFGGKEYFNIIDLGGNSVRFGDWSDDRDWERLFWFPDKPGKPGLAPVKTCPDCQGLVHAAVIQCKLPSVENPGEICGHIFDRKKFIESEVLSEMIIMTKGIDVDAIISKHKDKQPYFPFYEIGRQAVNNLVEKNENLTDEQVDAVFDAYFDKCKEWFKMAFPKKQFKEQWHKEEARRHFYEYLKTKFKHEEKEEMVW